MSVSAPHGHAPIATSDPANCANRRTGGICRFAGRIGPFRRNREDKLVIVTRRQNLSIVIFIVANN